MNKPKTAQKNGIHKSILDFEIQIDPLIPARWPDYETQKRIYGLEADIKKYLKKTLI